MRNVARTALMILLLGMLSGCTAMLLGGQSGGESYPSAGAAPSAADTSISGIIRQRFSQDPDVSRYTIGIRTVAGNVTLSGTVGSYPVRDKAVQLARTTDGVRAVDSRIVVNTNL
jgi:osmotically-inducible protein OsmY